MTAAALLAGGHSRRMGTDKAFIAYEGTALWQHQMGKLRSLGAAPLLLSCRAEQPFSLPPDVQPVHDEWPDAGPLAGIASCLRVCPAPLLTVLAVDLPQLPAELLQRLIDQSRPGCGAVIRHGGWYEPLAAVYPVTLAPLAGEMLLAGQRSMQDFLRRAIAAAAMQSVPAPPEAARWFENWNTVR
jgi:molybdenum cofactor guanylyltransferase